MTTFRGFLGRGPLQKDEDNWAASRKLTVFSSSGLGKSLQKTCGYKTNNPLFPGDKSRRSLAIQKN